MSDISWAGIGAAIGAFVTGLFAWLGQHRKSETDIEVAVLAEWQKLNGALADRLASVEKEFSTYRTTVSGQFEQLHLKHGTEIDEMRRSHRSEIDEMRKTHRAEMRAMRELNEGLQRQIAQNSQSTASLLGASPVVKAKDGPSDK